MFYYVYILHDAQGHLYIEFTSDLRARIRGHAAGDTRTTKRSHYQLIYYEAYRNKADVLGREKFLKGGSGRKYIYKQLRYFLAESTPSAT